MKNIPEKNRIVKENIVPAKVSLSGTSNFLELAASTDGLEGTFQKTAFTLEVKAKFVEKDPTGTNLKLDYIDDAGFTVKEVAGVGQEYAFRGTYKHEFVDDKTFLLVEDDAASTAENIRACLMRNPFFRAKYEISIPMKITSTGIESGNIIEFTSLGAGDIYKFRFERTVETEDEEGNKRKEEEEHFNPDFLRREGEPDSGHNYDSIDEGMGDVDIEADVYMGTGVFLGMDENPSSYVSAGRQVATMSKAYFGQPVWFDVNALMNVNKTYSDSFLNSESLWTDTGTMNDCRLVVRRNDGTARDTIYYSDIFYAVTGYSRTLDFVDMMQYVYHPGRGKEDLMKPLTNQPVLNHVKGQTQYFNFIFRDPDHEVKGAPDYQLGIRYDLYTQSGKFIQAVVPQSLLQDKDKFHMINNARLNIDEVVAQAEQQTGYTVGRVSVALCRGEDTVSTPLEFRILPACLHKVNAFAFLNSLGGWSSFNFGGEKSVTYKSDATTIYRTQTPDYTVSSRIEEVFDKEIKENFTVKTSPVSAEVAEWLKEMSASLAVYELSTKRYVVIDDFDVKHNTTDNLFTLEMKYHYSDTYNAVIK